MNEQDTRRRVKLYMLNKERFWDDKGTGHVDSVSLDDSSNNALLVRSEVDSELLLDSKILTETAYQKQQDTLIVWSENDNFDYALSFQEKAGCDDIWEKICLVQGKDPAVEMTHELEADSDDLQSDDDHYYETMGVSGGGGASCAGLNNTGLNNTSSGNLSTAAEGASTNGQPTSPLLLSTSTGAGGLSSTSSSSVLAAAGSLTYELPPCELSKLSLICDTFNSSLLAPMRRDNLSTAIETSGYIRKLTTLFQTCEDLEDSEGLRYLYDIFKVIFMLNKNALFEVLFCDELIMDTVGILEYEPPRTEKSQRIKHREYLKRQATFCDVLHIDNHDLIAKIHQTYRVQYIQDVILPTPSMLEENLLSSLNSFIFYNKVEIVNMIQEDDTFLKNLFDDICVAQINEEKKRDLSLFLKEFCMYSQSLQTQSRDYAFFKMLANTGILRVVEVILPSSDDITRSAAIDIFSYIVEFSPTIVREFIVAETKDASKSLINIVIEQMVNDKDPELGGAVQLLGVVRILVDPDNMLSTENKIELSDFLGYFYDHSMCVLLGPLIRNTNEPHCPPTDNYRVSQLLSLTLELCTFFVEHHSYHCSAYFIGKNVLRRVLVLLKSRHTFLRLAALRLFRRVVAMKDNYYNRYLIQHSLFQPIVEAFNCNGNRYNLLNSAIIELFEYIQYEDIKCLITHVYDQHYTNFESIDYVSTFKNLKKRYEQHKHSLKETNGLSPLEHKMIKRTSASPCFESSEDIYFSDSIDNDTPNLINEDGEVADDSPMPAVSELFSSQITNDREQICKFIERTRVTSDDNEELPCRIKPVTKNLPINISTSIVNSPTLNNTSLTNPTPVSSPLLKKTSLVDYDEDSDEDMDDSEDMTKDKTSTRDLDTTPPQVDPSEFSSHTNGDSSKITRVST